MRCGTFDANTMAARFGLISARKSSPRFQDEWLPIDDIVKGIREKFSNRLERDATDAIFHHWIADFAGHGATGG